MDFFKWKKEYEIGIEELDGHHRTFLEHLNEFYQAAASGNFECVEPSMVEKLREYATMHFHREEQLLRFVCYPDMERQAEQHIYFEKQVLALEAELRAGNPRNVQRVCMFLRDWFVEHILDEDKRFVPLVKQGRFDDKKK